MILVVCYFLCGAVYTVAEYTNAPDWFDAATPWWYWAIDFVFWPVALAGDVHERWRL